jgi:hypothetical protein
MDLIDEDVLLLKDNAPNHEIAARIFSIEDLDGDGVVTFAEYHAPKYVDEIEEELKLYENVKASGSVLLKDKDGNVIRDE